MIRKKVVVLGGGTGTSTLLSGLKRMPIDITAVISVSDNGSSTGKLREEFLIPQLFFEDEIKLVYSHIDRIITGGVMPVKEELALEAGDELRAEYFLQRREMGIINIGGNGTVTIDGRKYNVLHKEGMYVGLGAKEISFASDDASNPAKFYLNSAPAHTSYPTVKTPLKGTNILGWYKSNKEAIVGVSEPLLVAEVEKLCQKY